MKISKQAAMVFMYVRQRMADKEQLTEDKLALLTSGDINTAIPFLEDEIKKRDNNSKNLIGFDAVLNATQIASLRDAIQILTEEK